MNNYSDDLIKSIGNGEVTKLAKEYVVESADSFIQELLKNEITKHVPVFKTIVGVSRGALAIRDHIYMKKIMMFLFQTDKVSAEVKAKFIAKLKSNPNEVSKAGEVIWEILDSISSSKKVPMVGKVFEAYMANEINLSELIYLCEMIDKAYLHDLVSIEHDTIKNRDNLINIGYFEPIDYKKVIDDDFALTSRGMSGTPIKMQRTNLTHEGGLLYAILRKY